MRGLHLIRLSGMSSPRRGNRERAQRRRHCRWKLADHLRLTLSLRFVFIRPTKSREQAGTHDRTVTSTSHPTPQRLLYVERTAPKNPFHENFEQAFNRSIYGTVLRSGCLIRSHTRPSAEDMRRWSATRRERCRANGKYSILRWIPN